MKGVRLRRGRVGFSKWTHEQLSGLRVVRWRGERERGSSVLGDLGVVSVAPCLGPPPSPREDLLAAFSPT